MAATESSTRRIFIDDASPSIQFEGPWYPSTSSFSYSAVSGPIHEGTQHGLNGTGRITFQFSGTEIGPFGTSDALVSSTGTSDPTWECLIDGVRIPRTPPSPGPQNKRNLCQYTAVPDGTHTMVINVVSGGQPFWFDFFMMKPSLRTTGVQDPAIDDAAVFYSYQDPAIQYLSGGWQTLDNIGMMTQQAGSTMFMGFNGTKATWFGRMQEGFPSGPSSGSYILDNGRPVNFTIEGLLLDGTTRFQQLIFETPELPEGSHTLSVTYHGSSTPLILEYMMIHGGDLVFTGNPVPPPDLGNNDSQHGANDDHPHKVSTGVIVGAVVGGIAFISLIGFIVFLLRKLKQRRRAKLLGNIDGDDEPAQVKRDTHNVEVTPFMHDLSPTTAPTPLPASPSPSTGTFTTVVSDNTRPLSQRPSSSMLSAGQGPHNPHHSMLSYVSASEEKALLASRHASSSAYSYDSNQRASGSTSFADPRLRLAESTVPGSVVSGGSSNEKARLQYAQYTQGGAAPGSLAVVNSDVAVGHSEAPEGIPLVHHQDSGIRLTGEAPIPPPQFVDVPPSYTPQ